MNANLTHILATERAADLQRAGGRVRASDVDDRVRQPRRARGLSRLLEVRRTRLSARLATSPDSCDA